MDASRVALMRELLSSTGWVERTGDFARTLTRSTRDPGGLLLVGTPDEEPWHLAAHLSDEARYADLPSLAPTLVRWQAAADAPAHLSVTMERLEAARRGETVFVVAPDAPPAELLQRVADARHVGATVLTIDAGDTELEGLAHESLVVRPSGLLVPADADITERPSDASMDVSMDTVQHLVSVAAGETGRGSTPRTHWRDRLARVLDSVSGPPPHRRS